jgi:hypothetical protein
MRTLAACAVVLACACGGKGGATDGGDDAPPGDGNDVDGPPPETPLSERIVVSTIAAPAGALAGDSNWRIWSRGNLRVAPVFTVPVADCSTLVGYTTGGTPTARVAHIDANDQLVTTYDLGAFELRGLAVEPDGHFAALLWDGTQTLYVKRFDKTGAPGTSTSLADALAAPTDFEIGESRLEYGGGKYGAYFHVHGISDFANGHEGDALHWVDAASGAKTTGWAWGCSHSMSELLRYNGTAFLSACVTDCYPGTSGSNFATESIGGIYIDKAKKVRDVDGGCNGSVAGELGSLTPASDGWRLVFNTHQAPATKGQSSYSAATMNQDVGFAVIGNTGATSAVVWLTTTTGNEANATIARWQPYGDDTEQFVVGWSAGSTYKLARVAPNGDVLAAPIDITAKWGERDDPFRVHRNGDIVWSWFDAAGATSFKLARLKSGRAPSCSQL